MNIDVVCCVCREKNDYLLDCKHNLCKECMGRIKTLECPLCRRTILVEFVAQYKDLIKKQNKIINNPIIIHKNYDNMINISINPPSTRFIFYSFERNFFYKLYKETHYLYIYIGVVYVIFMLLIILFFNPIEFLFN